MGLDIYHFKVNDNRQGEASDIDSHTQSLLRFEKLFCQKQNEYIDWKAMFVAQGLNDEDYFARSRSLQGGFRGPVESYSFVLAKEASDPMAKVRIIFCQGSPIRNFPARLAHKFFGKPITIYGDFLMRTQLDTVVYAENVGYQRKGLMEGIHDDFALEPLIFDLAAVIKLYEMTEPALQPAFQANFVDVWDAERSFVYLSY